MTDISLILPVFNQEKKLYKAFDSLRHLNTCNIVEIIFVDDGSTDSSSALIIDFINKNENLDIRYLKKNNGGVSSTRNHGLLNAKGKYIWFIDPDDRFEVNHIDQHLEQIKQLDLDILIFGYNYINENDQILDQICFKQQEYEPKLDFPDLATNHQFESVWNKLFKKDFLNLNDITFNEKFHYGEDVLFTLDCLSKANKIYFSNLVTYNYYLYENSLSKKYIHDLITLRSQILQKIKNYATEKKIDIGSVSDLFIIETFISLTLNNKKDVKNHPTSNTLNDIYSVIPDLLCKKIDTNYKKTSYKVLKTLINLRLYRLTIYLLKTCLQ